MDLRYRLLNVFVTDAGDRFSGNPLCVFEDGRGLSDAEMQALARQFNLSETTFILPPLDARSHAQVRIFTPSFEMPFAGHPTLGTAQVVRSLWSSQDGDTPPLAIVLEMKVGLVEVVCEPYEPGIEGSVDRWTLRTARRPKIRPPEAMRNALAAMLSLPPDAVSETPLWVDTGAEQLIIPLVSAEAVRAAKPNPTLLAEHGFSEQRGAAMAYVWAPRKAERERRASEYGEELVARFFFLVNGSVVEDPATGSACANLGGWFLAMKGRGVTHEKRLPLQFRVRQGEAILRPSFLDLRVDEQERIFVSGAVLELGSGVLRL